MYRFLIIVAALTALFHTNDAVAATETVLYRFGGGADGANPLASLLLGANGVLFGTTSGGTALTGTVFMLTPPARGGAKWSQKVLHVFSGGADGGYPVGGLIADKTGALFGTTYYGGTHSEGTVFKLLPPSSSGKAWTYTVIDNFQYGFKSSLGGAGPGAGLIEDSSGALYGTTDGGGSQASAAGTVFKLTPPAKGKVAWTESIIHSFSDVSGKPGDGNTPRSGVLLDAKSGEIFGTTEMGGLADRYPSDFPSTCGTVFKLTPIAGKTSWRETILYAFSGKPDGCFPTAGLLRDASGRLFGTSLLGGTGNHVCGANSQTCGTVFGLFPPASSTTTSTARILHSFLGGTDGGTPWAGLTFGPGGTIWGTAFTGGRYGGCPGEFSQPRTCGVVFTVVPSDSSLTSWTEKVIYNFKGGADGGLPRAPLIFDSAGVAYGTTYAGGTNNAGTVFKIAP